MLLRTVLRAAALALLLVPGVALAERAIEPEVLRYFTPEVVRANDAFVWPLRVNWVVQLVLYLGFMGVFMGFQLNRRLKRRCEAVAARWAVPLGRVPGLRLLGPVLTRMWKDPTWGGALLFALAYLVIQVALNLPTDFYFGWYYEHAHGTGVESVGRWAWDATKGVLSEAVALSALAFGLYGLARRLKNWWLVLGVPCAVLMFVLGGVMDPLRVQLFHKQEPLPDGPTKQAIAAALKKAGVEYEDIFQQRMGEVTRRTNAFVMGDGPTRRIVVWDTLTRAMSPAEAANAVSHELGHLKDRSPNRVFLASLALLPVLFALSWILRRLGRSGRLGFDGDHDVASLPMAFLLLFLLDLVAGPVGNAYSRELERRADAYALQLLQDPEGFRGMMVKVARTNLADVHPPAWVRYVLHGHPPVMERLGAAEAFAREHGITLPEATPDRFSLPEGTDPLKLPLPKPTP